MKSNLKALEARYRAAFAEQLRMYMADVGMCGNELARKAAIPVSSIYNYQKGRTLPDAFALARICVALGVDVSELLGIKAVDE